MKKETVLTRIERLIDDVGNRHLSDAKIINYMQEIERLIVVLKPNAFAQTETFTCVAGVRQVLTSTNCTYVPVHLLDIHYNFGTATTSRGKQIVALSRDILYDRNPDWMASTATKTIRYVDHDVDEPLVFWNYPPLSATSTYNIKLTYSALTATLNTATTTQTLSLGDEYRDALIEGMLWKIYEHEDIGGENSLQRAEYHYKRFMELLGVKSEAEKAVEQKE